MSRIAIALFTWPVRPYSDSGRTDFSVKVETSSKIILFEISVEKRYYSSMKFDHAYELREDYARFALSGAFALCALYRPTFSFKYMKIFMMIVDIIERQWVQLFTLISMRAILTLNTECGGWWYAAAVSTTFYRFPNLHTKRSNTIAGRQGRT